MRRLGAAVCNTFTLSAAAAIGILIVLLNVPFQRSRAGPFAPQFSNSAAPEPARPAAVVGTDNGVPYDAPATQTKVEKVIVAAPNSKPAVPTAASAAAGASGPSAQDRSADALRRHELIRSGSISLLVADVERTVSRVRALAVGNAGDVTALDDERPPSVTGGHIARLTVSVPDDRFDAVLGSLAALGGIRMRNVTTQDVGDRIVDVGARLRNLRRTESDLLHILDRSGKISEVLDVENQLGDVRDSLERFAAERAELSHRVAYATIDVTLATASATPAAEPSAAVLLANAWHAALERVRSVSLAFAAHVFLIAAFVPYWLGAAIFVGLGARIVRRRFDRSQEV